MTPGPSDAEAACIEAFREQRASLWRFFLRGTSDPQAAEDLVQESLLRVWDHRADLAGDPAEQPGAARRYLWRVARNLMIDEIRARQRQRARDGHVAAEGVPEAESSNPGPDEIVERTQCLEAVRRAAAELPRPRMRRCLRLWLEDRTLVEIADEMKIGLGQARGLLQRGKVEALRRAARTLGLPDPVRRSREEG